MARTRIVYHADGTKEETTRRYQGDGSLHPDFHENIIRVYHQLECEGKLTPRMNGRSKTMIRDLHTLAQTKEYWT